MRILIAVLSAFTLCSCSTFEKLNSRDKTLSLIGIGAATGGIYGASREDYKTQNALMWGGVLATVAAVVGVLKYDQTKEVELLKQEKKLLIEKSEPQQKRVAERPATFSAKIPDKYKKLIQPGEWKVFEIDQWIEDGENRLVHQDQIMELTPPSLSPQSKKEK